MGKIIGFEDCKTKIINFLKLEHKNERIKELKNQKFDLYKAIDYLETFDFNMFNTENRYRNDEYSDFYSKDKNTHCDFLPLARAVYVIIWTNVFENLYYDINCEESNYTRDTIISDKKAVIGNFMLLPRKAYHRQSFNTYRKKLNNDDFWQFLELMKKIYAILQEINYNYDDFYLSDELPYWEYIVRENSFYFDKIRTFSEFMDVNLLKGFENSDTFLKKRSKILCSILKYRIVGPNYRSGIY